MLTALMDEDTHAKFQALRRDIKEACGDRVAQVFVPVGADAPPQPSGAPRLLFIGKATRDFSQPDLASFEGARASAVGHLSALPQGVSAFWQFARAIAREVLRQTGGDASDGALAAHCGWSNLAKIGDIYDNPGPASLAIQAPLCVEALRAEIARFKPTGIVIAATNFAQREIIEPVFGDDWSQDVPDADRIAYKLDARSGAAVVWTNHPQGMTPEGMRALVQTSAAELIVQAMRGEPLPRSAV